ncbi:MAG: 16S rRNA (cytosine(1402)-N(4))-methyltransferase RsmH [Planctomycetaceae bacterium]|nr:MAG: 16S rRNA (cytosine(1402)-N(4))-methyltransferase RsmH [Planctomycetaceae bacterium]
MPEPSPEKPRRRQRYRGKNPRAFHEKYKELDPERYPDDLAKVLSSGKTPAGTHRPVMLREILEVLSPKPGEIAVDCTLGYGGHARELLAAVQPGGRLIGVDADPIELARTETRLRTPEIPLDALVVRRMNFAGVAGLLAVEAPGGADLLLADLGASSMQIDDPTRGFTFKADGPLDMRMNPGKGMSAATLLATIDEESLATILADCSDEPFAGAVAQAILRAQRRAPYHSKRGLAEVIGSAFEQMRTRSGDTANEMVRRVFQALRIAVNDEFGALESLLRNLAWCLKPAGRVAIVSFHSGEDRRVKAAFKKGLREGLFSTVSEEVVRASFEEQRANPRSSAAKLRFAVRPAA